MRKDYQVAIGCSLFVNHEKQMANREKRTANPPKADKL
jgi:hypothetical protein